MHTSLSLSVPENTCTTSWRLYLAFRVNIIPSQSFQSVPVRKINDLFSTSLNNILLMSHNSHKAVKQLDESYEVDVKYQSINIAIPWLPHLASSCSNRREMKFYDLVFFFPTSPHRSPFSQLHTHPIFSKYCIFIPPFSHTTITPTYSTHTVPENNLEPYIYSLTKNLVETKLNQKI